MKLCIIKLTKKYNLINIIQRHRRVLTQRHWKKVLFHQVKLSQWVPAWDLQAPRSTSISKGSFFTLLGFIEAFSYQLAVFREDGNIAVFEEWRMVRKKVRQIQYERSLTKSEAGGSRLCICLSANSGRRCWQLLLLHMDLLHIGLFSCLPSADMVTKGDSAP